MEHDTLANLACCEQAWPLTPDELAAAAADGIPTYALTGLEHVCCLEPEHADACACQCGASR